MQPNWQQPQPTGYGQFGNNMGVGGGGGGGGGGGMMPQRTGYPGGPQAMGGGFTQQPTGMMGGGMSGHLTPMMTGMPRQQQQQQQLPPPGGMSGMTTGGGAGGYSFLNAPPPSQFSSGGISAQRTGFQGIQPQQTGWQGGLTAQPTGMGHDPRLMMMMGSFMPGNMNGSSLQPISSAPSTTSQFNSSFPPISQLSQNLPINPNAPLTQNFQSLLSDPKVRTPKVPWVLSKQEKKDYDQIFRAWTGGSGGGFIEGAMAQEVFGQSGLGRDDLMKIWNLSDVNNRGKLNLPEFHVAMGLIYRALNGNEIPDELPAEMVPPSIRDIDSTVDFVKGLLRDDSSNRNSPSPSGFDNMPGTFNRNKADATVYKHDDSRAKGYKSSSRHIDRNTVRYDGEGGDAELEDIKRQLANSSNLLDRSAEDYSKMTREDEELEAELEDLKYRVRRVKEDIEYVSKGKRTPEKDEERRKLERELLYLMHERLPEVERKQHEVEERRKRAERDDIKARDTRNESYGRYNGGRNYDRDDRDDDRYRPSYSSRDRSRERDRPRDYDRRDDREGERRSSRDYDSYSSRRPISPPARRSPPPAAPRESENKISAPPPAPAPPTSVAAAAPGTKNMTPEERAAHIRAQAQARIQARLKALGMATDDSQSPSNSLDNSVQERMEREKREAEEKSKMAEKEQEDREAKRRARLESAGVVPSAGSTASPSPVKSAMKKTPAPPPPPPSKRPGAPPAPPASRIVTSTPAKAAPPAEDPEDAELREREEAHKKAMAERQARLKRMQEEEEEAQRAEEELLKRKREQSAPKSRAVDESPAPSAASPPSNAPSTNPFHRIHSGNTPSSPPSASASTAKAGSFNPFLRPPQQTTTPPTATPRAEEEDAAPPPPPPPPAPPAPEPTTNRSMPTSAPPSRPAFAPPEEEWDVIGEKQDDSDDSSDDDYAGSRSKRGDLARALFGGIMPSTSRPGSADTTSRPPSAPPAALAKLGGGDPMNRGGLFAAIQGGVPKLKKTQTVDKTSAPGAGKVVGDDDMPPQSAAPMMRSASPPPSSSTANGSEQPQTSSNRQSVDWYSGLASDADAEGRRPSHHAEQEQSLSSTAEEDDAPAQIATEDDEDPLADFDMTKSVRVRTLYPYEGQRDVDLSFGENLVLEAYKAKDPSSAWCYGTIVKDNHSGWFPSSYVAEIQPAKAVAKYAYTGNSDEELPFAEGDTLTIVDQSDADWYKAEKGGVIFIVPAAYVDLNLAGKAADSAILPPAVSKSLTPPAIVETPPEVLEDDDDVSDSRSDTSVDSYLSFDEDEFPSGKTTDELVREREDREKERLKLLQAAGLQLQREPSGVPARRSAPRGPRRRPPPAPRQRSATLSQEAPPKLARTISSPTSPSAPLPPLQGDSRQVDAYDRYSSYLEESRARPTGGRARSHSDVRLSQPRPTSVISLTSLTGRADTPPFTSTSPAKDSAGRLSGFMSRMRAQPPAERRITPIISGPMTSTSASQQTGTEGDRSTSFGQTWSSLVDASVLETMSPKERKRQEAMFELIATESDYVRDLQLIVEVFYATMIKLIDDKSLETIFSNIEDILLFNTTLLSSLEDRQKASRLYIDAIGDILRDQLPSVSLYKQYCVNQGQGSKVLQSLRQSNISLSEHLDRIRNEDSSIRSLDLSSFLLIPMQRLTRYPLLLRQILNYTDEGRDAEDIKAALESAESVLADVNESIREAEGQEKLAVLSEDLWIGGEGRLDLTAPTAYQGKRRLIKEGVVTKAKSGRKLHMVLCNDILVLIESKNLYRMPIPLHEASAKDTHRDPLGIQITQEYARGRDTIALRATSAKEAQSWITAINRGRHETTKARQAFAEQHRRRPSSGIGY